MKYRKSYATKMKMLEVIKHCFYENGYTGTTMREIGRRCNISQSLLYYYFRSKQDAAMELMADFYAKTEQILMGYINEYEQPFLYLLCLCRLLYKEVTKDPKELRFYEEIFHEANPYRPFSKTMLKAIRHYTKNPDLTMADAIVVVSIGDSVWARLVDMTKNGDLNLTIKEILHITDITRFSYLNIDRSQLEKEIAQAEKIVEAIPIQNIKLISYQTGFEDDEALRGQRESEQDDSVRESEQE